MHKLFLETEETYTGEQLSPLKNYLRHGLLGDSIISWIGPCNVQLDHMIDGEDLRVEAAIQADKMLHIVLEVFNQDLYAGILLQRIIGDLVRQKITQLGDPNGLTRRGDDLFWQDKKLNVSIATATTNSFLIHFGINVINDGTPVPTCALSDFNIPDANEFARQLLDDICEEVSSQKRAFCKVRTF